jgi:hypothetical protein
MASRRGARRHPAWRQGFNFGEACHALKNHGAINQCPHHKQKKGSPMDGDKDSQRTATRRGFIHTAAGVSAGITAAGFVNIFGIGAGLGTARAGASRSEDARTVLNLATTAETLAVIFYYSVITGATFHIAPSSLAYLRSTMDAEMRHLRALLERGGAAVKQQFYLPKHTLSDARAFVDTGIKLETVLAGAYLAATQQFAMLGQPILAATAARHAASEAQHLTSIAHLAGLPSHDMAESVPVDGGVLTASPALQSFITPGKDNVGPVPFPADRAFQAVLRQSQS